MWVEFNTYEALFWFLLGLSVYRACAHWQGILRLWLRFSVANVMLFGVTDVVELYTGGFFHTAPWLLYWKIVHGLGLMVSFVWYLMYRHYVR